MENQAKKMFLSACAYSKVARLINEEALRDANLYLPSQVNAALALEIYFKSLYFIEKGSDFKVKGRHSHDFHALFCDLSTQSKERLNCQFQSAISSFDMSNVVKVERKEKIEIPRDLEGYLQSWRVVFTEARYVYEKREKPVIMMFFPEIEQAVIDTIINLRPDFRS